MKQRFDGTYYQDFFKVAVENSSEIDKTALIRALKTEFFSFAALVGWHVHKPADTTDPRPTSVPSTAMDGNFLEAINTTLNLLDKVNYF